MTKKLLQKLAPLAIAVSSVLFISNNAHAEEKPPQYQLIIDYDINPFFEDYIPGTAERSWAFRKQIKRVPGRNYEEKEKSFTEDYKFADLILLEAAFQNQKSPSEIKKLRRKISVKYAKKDNCVDYNNPLVQKAMEECMRIRIDHFGDLLDTPVPSTISEAGFGEIMQHAYTRESLENLLNRQCSANESLRNSMLRTTGFVKRQFIKGLFYIMKEESTKAYDALMNYVGPELMAENTGNATGSE